MSDPNPVIRSRALEHFRKTVGLEGSGVHVNVTQQTAIVQPAHTRSFEQAMDRIRELHMRESELTPATVPHTVGSRSGD